MRPPQEYGSRLATCAGLALVVAMALTACAVGPDFVPAAGPATSGYTASELSPTVGTSDVAGAGPQNFQFGRDLSGQWWTLFGSPGLDALIEEAMARYPDIAAQQAALRAARENVRSEQGLFLPQLSGSGGYSRTQEGVATLGAGVPQFISSVYQANVNVSYVLDVFGGERRALEGLRAEAEAQNFVLEASYLTLTSNVASTVIQLASVRDQITATRDIVTLEETQLAVIQRRFELGSQTRADVMQQQSNLAAVRATLPPLQQQLAVAEHELALLTGNVAHDMPRVEFTLSDLKLPQDLPVTLPSSLAVQRPDILQQQAVVHQASAVIGVATANMLPQLMLSGSAGNQSLTLGSLFGPGSAVWSLAAGVTQPIFQGGTLRAKRRAAVDLYEQARAQYELTVLKAFQNVADTLTALDNDAQALQAGSEALDAAEVSLDLIQRQYDAGALNYVSLLTAQQAYQQARIAYVRDLANRYTDTVTLFQALGGGWWNRIDPGARPEVAANKRSAGAAN